jgi:hypothetical protein
MIASRTAVGRSLFQAANRNDAGDAKLRRFGISSK